jgi:hypothetical protein
VQGNHEQRNQQANLHLFNIKIKTTQMICESLKRGRGAVKSCFPFFFFQISFFIKCKGEQKQICNGKGEKKMVDLWVREKNQMQMVKKKMG